MQHQQQEWIEPWEERADSFGYDPELDGQLQTGTWATLAAGGLAVASCLAELSQGNVQGITAANGLAWATVVPLGFVLRAYLTLAGRAENEALRRSSQCLFGAILLGLVLDLAMVNTLPLGWRIATWIVYGIGLLALSVMPFADSWQSAEQPAGRPASETKAEEIGSRGSRAGVIGGVVAAVVILFKVAAKGIFAKVLVVRWLGQWLGNVNGGWEVGALGIYLLLGAALLLWFAIAKIRLREKLGGIAALVGWWEIGMVAGLTALLTWGMASVFSAVQKPGIKDEALERLLDQMGHTVLLIGIGTTLVWTALTALLFSAVRSRLAMQPE
jgi:hypothetical protein